jgi:micrococcal nuclease
MVKIIDGDTVDVDIDLGFDIVLANQRVRLFGIDTPESRTRDKIEKKYGLLAKDYVKKFLPLKSYQTLVTEKDDARGKFGRILGKFKIYDGLTDSEVFLHKVMIRDHIGVAYFGQSKDDIENRHLKNRELLIEKGIIL